MVGKRGRRRHKESRVPKTSDYNFSPRTRRAGTVCIRYNLLAKIYLVRACACQHRNKAPHPQSTYPYFLPECRRYGNIIFLVSSSVDIWLPSSPSLTTNSNRHSRSSVRPKRPQTVGLLGSQMKLNHGGKNKSYTSSGV